MTHRQVLWLSVMSLVGVLAVTSALLVVWLNVRGDLDNGSSPLHPTTATSPLIERGAYLARVGNCAGCHTARGGPAYAGSLGITTPFGTVFSTNLTPDRLTGLGAWSSADFWRAMHNGRSKDGRLLYPAFPYPNFSSVSREDSDAIYAFLQSLPSVSQVNRVHELRFPYNLQPSLAVWRALYFRPRPFEPEPAQALEWNRGAYIVRGLGHCTACHSPRNALGASSDKLELAGGLIPVQNWYAPSLASADEASVATWELEEIAKLLATGSSKRGSVLGPMADVVFQSTQHFSQEDLLAVATFLKALPQAHAPQPPIKAVEATVMARGGSLYKDQCMDCHGENGQGDRSAYPPLAGNRTVTMPSPVNAVRAVALGGFPPTTLGNPRPYGMPPFGQSLSNADLAAVLTFIRNSWGNQAGALTELDVVRAR